MDTNRHQERLARFAAAREWETFHSPANLAAALAVEACELLEAATSSLPSIQAESRAVIDQFVLRGRQLESRQWSLVPASTGMSNEARVRLSREIADVAIYLLRLADVSGVDLDDAIDSKIDQNEVRYAADDVRGSAAKRPSLPPEGTP